MQITPNGCGKNQLPTHSYFLQMLVYCGEYDAALLAMLNRKYWSFLTVLKRSLITQGHWPKSFIKRLQYHCIYHLEKKCFWYVTKLVWIIKSCLKYSHQTKLSLFTCSDVYRTKVLVAVSNVKSYKKWIYTKLHQILLKFGCATSHKYWHSPRKYVTGALEFY